MSPEAVTQQIARLTATELDECRRAVETLDRLCSFTLREPSDHLDLDRPGPALRPTKRSGAIATAISRSIPPTAITADTIREHPVTALEPDAARDVASRLEPGPLRSFYIEAAERRLRHRDVVGPSRRSSGSRELAPCTQATFGIRSAVSCHSAASIPRRSRNRSSSSPHGSLGSFSSMAHSSLQPRH
jgi:hypothetical protein